MQATGTPSDGTVLPASIASSGHFKIPQLTVNDDGADVDFRVEGDTEANLLFVDAGEDKVGIGTGTPSGARLHIVGSGNTGIKVQVGSSSADQIYLGNTGGASSAGTLTNVGFNLIQNGGVALAVDTSKNVGIGTTSPGALLHVKTTTSRTDSVEHMLILEHLSSGTTTTGVGTGIRFRGERNNGVMQNIGDIEFEADVNSGSTISAALVFKPGLAGVVTEQMRLTSAGTLHIGNSVTNQFNHKLCIEDTSGAIFYAQHSTSGIQVKLNLDNGNNVALFGTVSSDDLQFVTANSNALIIDSSQNVGIGTTSPDTKLHLEASNNGVTAMTSANNRLRFTDTDTDVTSNQPTGVIEFESKDSGNEGIQAYIACKGSNTGQGSLHFATGKDASSTLAERVTIDQVGRVGIGATSFSDTGTALTIKNMHSGSEHTMLEIICDDNESARVEFSETSTGRNGSIRYIFTSDQRAMTFHTNGSSASDERMRLTSGGRLMIGTTTIVGSSRTNTPGLQIKETVGNAFDNHIYLEGASTNGNADTGASLGFGGHDGNTARNWAQIRGRKENGTSGDTSSYMSFATRRSGVSDINEKYRITSMGSLTTAQSSQSVIGRDWTSGSLAAGATVNYDGSGGANTNGKLNFNSIGGNGGGHITCLSISSQDQNPSGAMIVAGVHGQGFNAYETLESNFDAGISVTFNGTVTIQNTSSETIYYAVNVIHLGTGNTTYLGR